MQYTLEKSCEVLRQPLRLTSSDYATKGGVIRTNGVIRKFVVLFGKSAGVIRIFLGVIRSNILKLFNFYLSIVYCMNIFDS